MRLSLQVQGKWMSYGPQGWDGAPGNEGGHKVIWGGSLAKLLLYLSSGASDPLNLMA